MVVLEHRIFEKDIKRNSKLGKFKVNKTNEIFYDEEQNIQMVTAR